MMISTPTTRYSVTGQGFPIFLLHGVGLTREVWDRHTDELGQRFTVVTYDLLGHGRSPKLKGPYKFSQFVAQLRDLADSLGFDRFGVAGFSFGGMVARAAAIEMPERVASLVVLNSPHDRTNAERTDIRKRLDLVRAHGPEATVDIALERWFTPEHRTRHPADIALVRKWVLENDKDAYTAAYERLVEGDVELKEAISRISCPVLFVSCEHDYGNSPAMAAEMARLVPNGRCVIIPGLRHMGLFEKPARFTQLLLDFFTETLPSSAQHATRGRTSD